jgi:cyclopropane-fatty-acyl-phospholipid synthase
VALQKEGCTMSLIGNDSETTAILEASELSNAVREPPRKPLAPKTNAPHSLAGHLVRRMLVALGNPAFHFVLWNGEVITTSDRPPIASITVSNRRTLFRLVSNPLLRFGEAYSAGRIVIDGDLVAVLTELYRAIHAVRGLTSGKRSVKDRLGSARAHSLTAARDNIHHHYDMGNDFYALWLGKTMAYTCAYYPTRDATLDAAQIAKMHHVCRKVRLRPGDHVVEAGCGWGTLAQFMARHYGVKVTAFNISREQVAYARERAKAAGLQGQVEYIEDDYRNIAAGTARTQDRYDAFVSIGMLEHVGVANYPELGRIAKRCLQPTGLGIIHSIGRNRPMPLNPWIEKHIFPGAYTPSLAEMMDIFESTELSVLDVENLRLHYASTLHAWRALFEQAKDRVATMFDDTFVRMWRLYLAGSEAAFIAGEMQLFQVVFAASNNNSIPWTRADLYLEHGANGRV